jgi:hypothetical protein
MEGLEMKEVQQLYNKMTEGIESASDLVLRINDLYSVILLLVTKALEVSPSDKKSFVIDSVKPMTNQYLEKLMKTITDQELETIDKSDG